MTLPGNNEINALLNGKLNPFERFTDLLSGKDDRQDIMIMLLYEIARLLAGQENAQQNGEVVIPAGLQVNIPLSVTSDKLLDKVQALTTDAIPCTVMGDCRKALRMVILIENGFDQAVSVKIIGNLSNIANSGTRTIATINVPAGETAGYGIKEGEWYPWIGVEATPAGNPTTGEINASLVKQVQGEV